MLSSIGLAALFMIQNQGTISDYNGYERHDFKVAGVSAIVVKPHSPRQGMPWIWRTEFFDHRPMLDLALLKEGFYLVHLEVGNTWGAPAAMEQFSQFYRELTVNWHLNRRVVLEGFSRGGLYAYNWAYQNPDKVMAIYGDAPVCDFTTAPYGRKGGLNSPDDWKSLWTNYGFPDEAAALAYPYQPIDKLEPLAAAKIPIIHVVGDADMTVPVATNTAVLEERYKKLHGTIEVIHKPGGDHHPHSLDDPSPLVKFIFDHMEDSAGAPPATVIPTQNPESRYDAAGWGGRPWLAQVEDANRAVRDLHPKVVLLGDSITQGFGGPGRTVSNPGGAAFDKHLAKFGAVNMGISGDRTQHLLWRVQHGSLDIAKPEVAVILIGTNNRPSDSPFAIAKGIEAVSEAVHAKSPHTKILITAVFPAGAEPTDPNRTIVAEINQELSRYRRSYVKLLDIEHALLKADGRADLDKMAGDALHLQGPGYEVWAAALEKELDRMAHK